MRRCDWCEYTTSSSGNLCTHRKSCKKRPVAVDVEKEQLRERVASLEQQLVVNPVANELRGRVVSLEQQLMANDKQLQAKDEQLVAKDRQLVAKDEQLIVKDEQLQTQSDRIVNLESVIAQQLTDTKDELKKIKKRKDNYAEKTAGRKTRTEPERRKVAMGQRWICANPDGKCILPGLLEEYDVDHIIPLWKGGSEEPDNLQALCPACHRRKTEKENKERNANGSVTDTLLQIPVWSTD